MDNLELYKFSIANAENDTDELYKKEKVIITKKKEDISQLMAANNKILDYITAFQVLSELNQDDGKEMAIVQEIMKLLETKGINNSEFTNYWCIHDMSYSSYESMPYWTKIEFLMHIIPEYIKNRHMMYKSHWYTATTLQVRSDSVAHKRSWWLAASKVSHILDMFWIQKYEGDKEWLLTTDHYYILPDKDGKKLFDFLKEKLNIKFSRSDDKQWKATDFLIKHGWKLYIIEHKHMKETWWWQDKQMAEVIDFIKHSDENVSYVVFLDGVYLNGFWTNTDPKTVEQNNQIIKYLEQNKNNYFVNTQWFIKLFS